MKALQQLGQLVFIDIPLQELQSRVNDMDTRGLVIDPGESYEQLYMERLPLYKKYAGVTIPGSGLTVEAVAAEIEKHVCERNAD
jgi:shikimate kinase